VTTTYITPASCRGRVSDLAKSDQAGRRLFRKQILPQASIEYEGRTLEFDRDYLTGVADAFNRRAFPSVPLQLATPGNEHNNDPQLTRGLVTGVDYVDGQGLYATVAMGREGAELVREWPELDVSVRLCEDFTNGGRHWDAALQHVLATWDPKITGMTPWEPVELSNTRRGPVVDLSGLSYARQGGKGARMPNDEKRYTAEDVRRAVNDAMANLTGGAGSSTSSGGQGGQGNPGRGDFADMSDDELADLARDYFGDLTDGGDADPGTGPGPDGGDEGDDDGADDGSDDDGDWSGDGIDARELVEASNAYANGLELANRRGDDLATQVHDLTADRDRQAFEREAQRWADAGIPAYAIKLARPALEGGGKTIELSNGSSWDAGAAFREVFQTFAKTGLVDMSNSVGTAYDGSDSDRDDATEQGVSALMESMGRGANAAS
jgi:hypothetical protein